jgi:hypothetical protein
MKRRGRKLSVAYARRKRRGIAKGLSLAQLRGHPTPKETYASKRKLSAVDEHKLQLAVKEMFGGKSLTASARSVDMSPEKFRRILRTRRIVKKRKGRWFVQRNVPRQMLLYSDGKANQVVLADPKAISAVGTFMHAVRVFLSSNNPAGLEPFIGKSIKDISGKKHRFETDPNTLYRLASTVSESFEEIYRYII